MSEIDSKQSNDGTSPAGPDNMARKQAYITLQKGLRERFPPGAALQAWLEWLDAVYSGDLRRPPPVTASKRPVTSEPSATSTPPASVGPKQAHALRRRHLS
jgi:hypothetical protein